MLVFKMKTFILLAVTLICFFSQVQSAPFQPHPSDFVEDDEQFEQILDRIRQDTRIQPDDYLPDDLPLENILRLIARSNTRQIPVEPIATTDEPLLDNQDEEQLATTTAEPNHKSLVQQVVTIVPTPDAFDEATTTTSVLIEPIEVSSYEDLAADPTTTAISLEGLYVSSEAEYAEILRKLEEEARDSLLLNPKNYVPDHLNTDADLNNIVQLVEESLEVCPICKDDYEEDEDSVLTSCKHKFHRVCLLGWMNHHHHVSPVSCPTCRAPVWRDSGTFGRIYS